MSTDELFQKFGRTFPRGSVLFREGDPGRDMYIIQSGTVSVVKRVLDVEKLLSVLGPGEFFGEMSIISNKPRSATAVVESDARLLVIDLRTFESMIRANAEIAVRLIKKLAERVADADAQIENLLLPDPPSRVVHHLSRLLERAGAGDDVLLEQHPDELPYLLGLRADQVQDVLGKLARHGVLSVEPGGIRIIDRARIGELRAYLELRFRYGDLG